MRLLTAAELGAFLGITPSGVRQVIRRHQVKAKGKAGRANLYDVDEVLRHAGRLDRRSARDLTSHMSH